MWRVRVTILQVEKQQRILCVLFRHMSLSGIYKYRALHNHSFDGKFMSQATMQIIRTSF
jgi:hypothetical protein